MLLKRKCTVCGERVEATQTIECDSCGRQLHEACAEFEQNFDCPDCTDEFWIGAVEF